MLIVHASPNRWPRSLRYLLESPARIKTMLSVHMLDKDTLSQLSKLKADIHASREFAEGTVASTNGRFGFVRLEDGRDAYLSPEKMQRVLPGDRVRVELHHTGDGKLEASLEKLLHSELQRFIATYRVKGNAHFVEPLDAHVNRWIFVAPKNRNNAKQEETLVAKVIQHPWNDSKAQAKVLDLIGKTNSAYYDFKLVCAKYSLNLPPAKKIEGEVKRIVETFNKNDFGERADLSHLDFVTIDSATTRDMDDALAVEKNAQGYTLYVAIADPASFIAPGSALAHQAEKKAQTLYLNGGVLPMLVEDLANNYFSLSEGNNKPALVCTIELDSTGAINNYTFAHALIRSKRKFSYEEVSQWLSASDTTSLNNFDESLLSSLQALSELANLRLEYRKLHHLVSEDQADYQFLLDENGNISDIVKREKTPAHQLVEEAMLLTNICAGKYLAEHQCGIHTVHGGFRADRIGEAKALLKEENIPSDTIEELADYCDLMRKLANNENQTKLIAPLKRMAENSRLDTKAAPHMGIGVANYATITSPIRRYADLYNHWKISELLHTNAHAPKALSEAELETLNENLQNGRQADRELKQTLLVKYAKTREGQQGTATIRIVTPQGFGARFEEKGIDGFVLFDKSVEKTFDAKRLTMTVGEDVYYIGKTVEVKLSHCDLNKKRISLELL